MLAVAVGCIQRFRQVDSPGTPPVSGAGPEISAQSARLIKAQLHRSGEQPLRPDWISQTETEPGFHQQHGDDVRLTVETFMDSRTTVSASHLTDHDTRQQRESQRLRQDLATLDSAEIRVSAGSARPATNVQTSRDSHACQRQILPLRGTCYGKPGRHRRITDTEIAVGRGWQQNPRQPVRCNQQAGHGTSGRHTELPNDTTTHLITGHAYASGHSRRNV